jgi:DNA-binding HxlR family transcriptional regulator
MKRTALGHHPCSIARTLDVVGEWWTPLILRDIAYGIQRFGEIQEDLGISTNILSDRLDALLEQGLLEREAYQQRPRRHEYRLTEKGAELIPALLALMRWGDRWTWPDGRGPVRVTHDRCDHEVHLEIRCPHCEREVTPDELRAKPRGPLSQPPDRDQLEKHGNQPGKPGNQLGKPGRVSGERLYSTAGGLRLGA